MNADLRIESRFKNARLWQAIEDRFRLERGERYGLVALAARTIGVSVHVLSGLLTLKYSAFYTIKRNRQTFRDGKVRDSAHQIADFFSLDPEILFPRSLYALALPNVLVREFESERVISLQQAQAQHLLPSVSLDTDSIANDERRTALESVLKTLTPREEGVLKMRFGLEDGVEHTLEEVGLRYGVNRERIRQIEAKGLRHMRHPSRSRKLREYLDDHADL